jgi:GH24 family phage-related lysozyme (muramidase)
MNDGTTLGEVGWGHSVSSKWGIKTTLDTQYGLQNPDTKEPVIGITITKEQAQNLFNSDIQTAQAIWLSSKNGFGQDFNSLSINKKVALTSLSYNSGATYIGEVVKLGKAGKWEELSKKWVNFIRTSQSGTETGLRNRRKVEALLLTQE